MTSNIYTKLVDDQIPRLLGMVDANEYSPSHGSFDRDYWLHRTHDFSSSARQQGMLALSILYKNKISQLSLFKNPSILKVIIASMNYTCNIAKADGSFDEWYPNERGWAGPTAYVLYSFCETYNLISNELCEKQKTKFKLFIRKSASFLANNWEVDVLANHIAIALVAIFYANQILEDEVLEKGYEILFKKFETYHSNEGWSKEYDGCDVGYQSATLSFLARIHRVNKDKRIEELCHSYIKFLSYFVYPDGSFSRAIGSRSTENLFHLGFEYWANYNDEAKLIASKTRKSLEEGFLIRPQDQEDHYLTYRLPELLEAHLAHNNNDEGKVILPYQSDEFVKHFSDAGIYIVNNKKYYFVLNYKFGGKLLFFSKNQNKLIKQNSGYLLKSSKEIYSNIVFKNCNLNISNNKVTFDINFNKISFKLFTPFTNILFRLFMVMFGKSSSLAAKFKSIIRKLLMFNQSESVIKLNRKIIFTNNSIKVCDLISNIPSHIVEIKENTQMSHRLVPQSRYAYPNFNLNLGKTINQNSLQSKNEISIVEELCVD